MIITLLVSEIEELDKTLPEHRRHGGFQSYMVELQDRLNRDSREIDLAHKDLVKINRYASYTSGGYQTRLRKIFGRTLGRYLAGLHR